MSSLNKVKYDTAKTYRVISSYSDSVIFCGLYLLIFEACALIHLKGFILIKRFLLCQDSYERAKALLKSHNKEHKNLAEALLRYETLDAKEIQMVLEGKTLETR